MYPTKSEMLLKFPYARNAIEHAAKYIQKTVVVTSHTDEEGDHIPIGTIGFIVGFEGESADGLVLAYADKKDLIFPEEVEIIDNNHLYPTLNTNL